MHTNYKNKTTRYAGSDRLLVVPSGRDVANFSVLVMAGIAVLVFGIHCDRGQNLPVLAM